MTNNPYVRKEKPMHTFSSVDEVKQAIIDTLLGGSYSSKENAGQHLLVKYNNMGCKFHWYTDKYEYSIQYVHESSCLLGAFDTRYTRAGEDWHRGNDLYDGPANQDTLDMIIRDFISNELCTLSPEVNNEINVTGKNDDKEVPDPGFIPKELQDRVE